MKTRSTIEKRETVDRARTAADLQNRLTRFVDANTSSITSLFAQTNVTLMRQTSSVTLSTGRVFKANTDKIRRGRKRGGRKSRLSRARLWHRWNLLVCLPSKTSTQFAIFCFLGASVKLGRHFPFWWNAKKGLSSSRWNSETMKENMPSF